MAQDLKILFICFLLFSCQKKSDSQRLVQLIEDNYANMVVNGEANKRVVLQQIKEYSKKNELNHIQFDSFKSHLHQMRDGHLTLVKKKMSPVISSLDFHPGSLMVKSCFQCVPALPEGKYSIESIDHLSINEYFLKNKWSISASTEMARRFRVIRNITNAIVIVKNARGESIEIKVPARDHINTSHSHCVQSVRLDTNLYYIQLNSFWCQNQNEPNENRAMILQRFTQQWHQSIKNINSKDEIILDVRENGGGGDAELNLVLSQFLEGGLTLYKFQYLKKTHPGLSKLFAGKGFAPVETAILPLNTEVLKNRLRLLISPGCFSSCDLLARILKREQRALLIGEPTHAGIGDPVVYPLNDEFDVIIPTCTVSSLEGEPFEGVEVQPDLFVTQDLNEKGDTVLIKASTLK